jgi:membrane associated rhomboid family serine protease
MFPVRDTIQSRNYPVVNNTIIAVNVLFYLIEMAQGNRLEQFMILYGLVPIRYSVPEIAAQFTFAQQLVPFLTFMFIHGGILHLLGNMWTLYIFGDNVEDRLGPFRYLVFYFLCGLASGLSHLFFNWHSQMPTIGASGAIAGVMGAYFILYPRSRILTLIPIIIIPYFVELPAYIFLGIWFLIQFISAAGASAHAGGIAWWAHIGGFLFGMLFLKLFLQVPETGISQLVRRKTYKQSTPRLQVINTAGSADDPHLYGSITITPREALLGARKVVNIPWGFQKRMFSVVVPAGITDTSTLRLAGLGRRTADNKRGDLYLKVKIQQ